MNSMSMTWSALLRFLLPCRLLQDCAFCLGMLQKRYSARCEATAALAPAVAPGTQALSS